MIGYKGPNFLWIIFGNDWLPGAVHQHPPDPLLPGSSGGRDPHFSPGTQFNHKFRFLHRLIFGPHFWRQKRSLGWVWISFLKPSIADRWRPFPLRRVDGFEPGWSNLLTSFQRRELNIVIHEHQFHSPGWRLPFWGGWTWKGSLRGRLSSPNSWKCSPASPESLPAQIFSFSPPAHLRRPPAGQGISLTQESTSAKPNWLIYICHKRKVFFKISLIK